jgi:thiol-disulfide isomerase/thioredoxin
VTFRSAKIRKRRRIEETPGELLIIVKSLITKRKIGLLIAADCIDHVIVRNLHFKFILKPMRSLVFILSFLVSSAALAQTGYKIEFKVEGLKDTTAYLGYYYGESTFVKDTANVDSKGQFVFDGNKSLDQGVYFLVLDKTRLFDFVVSTDQQFVLSTNTTDYFRSMVVAGDQDNKLFFENMMFNMERHKEAEPFIKILQDSTLKEDQKKTARESFNKVNEKVTAFQEGVIGQHPATLTARIFKANKPVRVPDPPKKADGSIDSTFQLKWYREHFFDNFNLADDAMIRMPKPIYQEKINEYLDKLFVPQPDTLKKAISKIIQQSKKNSETYKYSVWACVVKYQAHEIMGLDEVYVNLYDTYFATGDMNFWANEKMRKNLKDAADRMRKSLVGKTGANLIMQDINKNAKSMYDIKNKYTLLYIFDPDCGHCKEETPKLSSWYKHKKFDLEVYAVSLDTSMAKMKDWIKTMDLKWISVNGPRTYVGPVQDLYDCHTTPSLYILDNRKKIIAKKIPVDKVEDFLQQHERVEKAKAARKL